MYHDLVGSLIEEYRKDAHHFMEAKYSLFQVDQVHNVGHNELAVIRSQVVVVVALEVDEQAPIGIEQRRVDIIARIIQLDEEPNDMNEEAENIRHYEQMMFPIERHLVSWFLDLHRQQRITCIYE